ncbi:uncharacterized protein LOC125547746 [Triticum urartu]|uniref:uncharacterized protein LOC125547746 n=1 Tax=Triticum urartu TaxID=4572 RepID=UPI002044643B|nr:uncharacterized protein LOC125547746 [Triticum urartu]
MCFEFSSCFGGERSNRNRNEAGERNNNRNGYYGGADHKAPQTTYQQPPAAVDEADIEAPKLPAWHNKVSDHAYTARLQEAAADHRNNAATDYHHYPTTALGRY